jgi:beta-lactamase class A
MIDRREFVAALLPLGAAFLFGPVSAIAEAPLAGLAKDFAAIEAKTGGRLGVAVIDTETGARTGYRAAERFAMCSTSKLLSVGAVLARVDVGAETLDRVIPYTQADLVTYSPETSRHAGAGMTLAALCRAAITLSDNTAANLLLTTIGGPKGFTAYARRIGDAHTRLDRTETTLNEAAPGDPRDTTTPADMARNLEKLTLGRTLSPARPAAPGCAPACRQGGGSATRPGPATTPRPMTSPSSGRPAASR